MESAKKVLHMHRIYQLDQDSKSLSWIKNILETTQTHVPAASMCFVSSSGHFTNSNVVLNTSTSPWAARIPHNQKTRAWSG